MNSEIHAAKTFLAVVSIWVEAVSAATKFYQEVLGLDLLTQHGGRPHFLLGDTYLVILRGTPVLSKNSIPERFHLLALGVDDLGVDDLGAALWVRRSKGYTPSKYPSPGVSREMAIPAG